jgi:hypothetical protein
MKLFFLLIICISSLFCGCSNKSYIDNNIAEVRKYLFEGKKDNIVATFICGQREEEYVANGYSTKLIDFGIITFSGMNLEDYNSTDYSYFLSINDEKYSGFLQKNPFDNSLVGDIKKEEVSENDMYAVLKIGEFESAIMLKRYDLQWCIKVEDVKNIILDKFNKELKYLIKDKEFCGEIYIKFINDSDKNESDYYWYVSIIGRNGGKLNAIISNKTGEVLSFNSTLSKF